MNSRGKCCCAALFSMFMLAGCSQEKGGVKEPRQTVRDHRTGSTASVSTSLRPGATWPVTHFQSAGAGGEVCDFAISAPCFNSSESSVSFNWHELPSKHLLKLNSGLVMVQGSFPQPAPMILFPVPWPIVATNRVFIGSEGTTFAVYTDFDGAGKPRDLVFLYSGGPLEVEIIGSSAPAQGTQFPPGDLFHRKLFADAAHVMFTSTFYDVNGNIKLKEPMKIEEADFSIASAFQCVENTRKAARIEKNGTVTPAP